MKRKVIILLVIVSSAIYMMNSCQKELNITEVEIADTKAESKDIEKIVKSTGEWSVQVGLSDAFKLSRCEIDPNCPEWGICMRAFVCGDLSAPLPSDTYRWEVDYYPFDSDWRQLGYGKTIFIDGMFDISHPTSRMNIRVIVTVNGQSKTSPARILGPYVRSELPQGGSCSDNDPDSKYDNNCTPCIAPIADFKGNRTSIGMEGTVYFTDLSTNNPTSWLWGFGDGTSSTLKNPSHKYNVPGTYTVSLKATNSCGSNTKVKLNYITVTPFTATIIGPSYICYPPKGQPPITVNWCASVSGGMSPYAYQWYKKWGDGPYSNYYPVGNGSCYTETFRFSGYGQYAIMYLKVEVTDSNGVKGTATKEVIVSSDCDR